MHVPFPDRTLYLKGANRLHISINQPRIRLAGKPRRGELNDGGGTPQTHYRVEALEALKGSLSGTIAVSEQGGAWPGGAPFRMDGDPHLLEVGKSYLLATRHIPAENGGGHLVLSAGGGYGKIELPESPGGESGGILATTYAAELRTRFAAAIANQIPFILDGGD